MVNFKKLGAAFLGAVMFFSSESDIGGKFIYAENIYTTNTCYNVSEFMETESITNTPITIKLNIDAYKNLGVNNMFGKAVKNSDGEYEIGFLSYSNDIKDGKTEVSLKLNIPKDGSYEVCLLAENYNKRGFSVKLGDQTAENNNTIIDIGKLKDINIDMGIYTAVFNDLKAGTYDLKLNYLGETEKNIDYFSAIYIKPLKQDILYYKDTSLSFEERAADLVSRMTLEEKISQLGHGASDIERLDVSKYNYWREGIHGVARQGKATSFPSSLSMSNTWDRNLIYRAADITSTEARAKNPRYDLSYWSPTINMARDPRWGRNEETYGEDPYLTGQYAVEFVKGMQGSDKKYLKTIATLKHFAANNCEGERQGGSSVMDEQTLYDYYTKAFKTAVEQSKAASVMTSYNAITLTRNGETVYDYIASPANKHLITDLLRRNWGFDGYVTGDCGAVNNLNGRITYKRTFFPDVKDLSTIPQSATIALAIKAGNDLDCGSVSQSNSFDAIKNNYMTEDDIDLAVYRLFLQRMRTGEFDEGAIYQDIKDDVLEKEEHIAVAEEAAEKSWVLLKNEDNILPISNNIKKVAIVGRFSDEVVLGDYSGTPDNTISPYEGIKSELAKINPNAELSLVGSLPNSVTLFNIKSLNLILKDGKIRNIDLSKAEDIKGMDKSANGFENVTIKAQAVIKGIDFSNVVKVEAEIAAGNQPESLLKINYGKGGPLVSQIKTNKTNNLEDYVKCYGDYIGEDGGYNQTADLYLSVSPIFPDFSIENNKEELDNAELIIAYAGTDLSDSKESHDRNSIKLPDTQSHVAEIAKAYPEKTIVVMQTVGQIDVSPFENNSKAILWTSYNGQTQGKALGKILTGAVNPSGKLSTTWYNPNDLEIMTVNSKGVLDDEKITWNRNDYGIRQKENFPGRTYQYYNGNAQYPFGYGLSYTSFEYSDLTLSKTNVNAEDEITASVKVKNTGDLYGSEVVQLYIQSPEGDGKKQPLKQLKGFERIELEKGSEKTVSMTVKISDLSFYDETKQKLYIPQGQYNLMVGRNSDDKKMLKAKFNVTGKLACDLKTVQTIPSGISVVGAIKADGTLAGTIKSVNANTSAVMTDDTVYDLYNAKITYKSNNTNVAVVSEKGEVTAGTEEGVALITVSVTINGNMKEDVFPVKCVLKNAMSDLERQEYINKLDTFYKSFKNEEYSEKNWTEMTSIYNTAKKNLEIEIDPDKIPEITENIITELREFKKKPIQGLDEYEIKNIENMVYNKLKCDITYNGDERNPKAVLITKVYDNSGNLLRTCETFVSDTGEYIVNDIFNDKEKISLFVCNGSNDIPPLSKKYEYIYTKLKDPKFVCYNFTDEKFNSYVQSTDDTELKEVDKLYGYGGFNAVSNDYKYTYNGKTYDLKRGLQAGGGSKTKRCVYFKPSEDYKKCKVTVVFDAAKERYQVIYQDGHEAKEVYGNGNGVLAEAVYETDDMKNTIYTYGGGSNKTIFAVFVEYED